MWFCSNPLISSPVTTKNSKYRNHNLQDFKEQNKDKTPRPHLVCWNEIRMVLEMERDEVRKSSCYHSLVWHHINIVRMDFDIKNILTMAVL